MIVPPTPDRQFRQLSMTKGELDTVQNYYSSRDADGSYERAWGYINPVAAAYWRMRDELVSTAVLQYCNLTERLTVLEVGVGHGHELAKFAQLGIAQCRMAGIDLVFHRLGTARQLYPGISFSQQDATAIAFADNSFDIVCQFTCVMHAQTKQTQHAICREMARVVKPGGIIIWWDQTPVRRRVAVCRRIIHSLRRISSPRHLVLSIARKFKQPPNNFPTASDLPQPLSHILPMDRSDLIWMFSGLKVHIQYAGVDYPLWEAIWPRAKTSAEWLWRKGWLSQHCFAVVEKPK